MNTKLVAEIKRRAVPALYSQQNNADPIVYLEITLLGMSWRWLVTECNMQEDGDILFFGYVCGLEKEWGFISIWQSLKEHAVPYWSIIALTRCRFQNLKGRTGYESKTLFGDNLHAAQIPYQLILDLFI